MMKDTATRRSRGFGFVIFGQPGSVDKVLAVKDLRVDGRKVGHAVSVCGGGGLESSALTRHY